MKVVNDDMRTSTVEQATMAQKNICMPNSTSQCVAISSATKSSPPIGALNAAATPPATPAPIKSLRSHTLWNGFRKSFMNLGIKTPWLTSDPNTEPMWIIGPSGPAGIPLPTARAQLANFAMTTEIVKVLGIMTPFRKADVSGIPDPAARGSPYRMTAELRTTNDEVKIMRTTYVCQSQSLRHPFSMRLVSPSVSMIALSIVSLRYKIEAIVCLRQKARIPHINPIMPLVVHR
mmetsp:Transcript_39642/g.53902  ORF Transcript_39642/g.53902 Transcript_39642/m.53902 type:complete len:233 (-) Transcript_39642:20-718(-)